MKHPSQNQAMRGRETAARHGSRRTVHFELDDRESARACVAGSFNGWNPRSCPMTRQKSGKWAADIELAPGTYEYRFVLDGRWIPDPNADHTVVNPFGERNSLITVT